MSDLEQLHTAILEKLATVIDPETGADVVRMRLVEHLTINPEGQISYSFRPSSRLCPIAVFLALQIKMAVASVPGVKTQQITISDYIDAEALTELINQEK